MYFPSPQYPLVVDYSQARLSEMFALREKLLAKEEEEHWGMKVRGISIGSYWVETILSVLFFQEVYNNRTVSLDGTKSVIYIYSRVYIYIPTVTQCFRTLLLSTFLLYIAPCFAVQRYNGQYVGWLEHVV